MLIFGFTLVVICFGNSQIPFDTYHWPNTLQAEDGAGSVWPQPASMTSTSETFRVDAREFAFTLAANSHTCDILLEAIKRYELIIYKTSVNMHLKFYPTEKIVKTLVIDLVSKCEEYPSESMVEAYTLDISENSILYSESVWGILRGLESFSQLMYTNSVGDVLLNSTHIVDFPRFSFRGIMIDTSRHYLTLDVILKNIDAMAYNKLNVLHWHIVDNEAFPYVSQTFPDISEKGSYRPSTHIYTPEAVQTVIEYARLRGIRVVPEFDTPGHTESWGKGQLDLLTPCYSNGKLNGRFGPINPTLDSTYVFIDALWKEIKSVFPDNYLHLGGDEVDFSCWRSNPDINKWMDARNISGQYAMLEQHYIQEVIEISNRLGFSYIVWQEVIDNGVKAKQDTIVDVWKNNPSVDREIARITALGYRVLVSQPWYLNYISYGSDWKKYYLYDPTNFKGTDAQKALVMGGEACMWGEYVDSTNILPRLWPRAGAVAERLWSPKDVTDTNDATLRLHQQRCRMLQRGIPAEPIWKGSCDYDF